MAQNDESFELNHQSNTVNNGFNHQEGSLVSLVSRYLTCILCKDSREESLNVKKLVNCCCDR